MGRQEGIVYIWMFGLQNFLNFLIVDLVDKVFVVYVDEFFYLGECMEYYFYIFVDIEIGIEVGEIVGLG